MDTNSLEWMELEHLTRDLSDLHVRLKAVRAMKHLGAMRAIEREIAVTASQRQRLVRLLSGRLADQVIAPLAPAQGDASHR
jgi:hypothetical protein